MQDVYKRQGEKATASRAILEGLAADGGLFVPEKLPALDRTMAEFAQMDYRETAYEVMKLLLTDFSEEELRDCIARDVYKRQGRTGAEAYERGDRQ